MLSYEHALYVWVTYEKTKGELAWEHIVRNGKTKSTSSRGQFFQGVNSKVLWAPIPDSRGSKDNISLSLLQQNFPLSYLL